MKYVVWGSGSRVIGGAKTVMLVLWLVVMSISVSKPLFAAPPQRFVMGAYYPAIANLVTRADFQVAINLWLEEFSDPMQLSPAYAVLYDDIDSLHTAFVSGQLDFIMAPPLLLAKHIERELLADGFVGTAADGTEYGMLLLSRKDSGIETLSQMHGSVLMLPERDDLAETFLDTLTLKTYRQPFKNVFKQILSKDRQSGVVLALFFKQADVGLSNAEIFNLMVELNPQLQEHLQVLGKFPTKSSNYGYFHRDFPADLRRSISERVKELNQKPRPQQVLRELRMASLVPNSVDDLVVFDRLLDEHRALQKGVK